MSRYRVLIVEDDAIQRDLYVAALGTDYDLLTAATGAEAFELAPSADMVLLDAGLPDMDGVAICRHLKKDKDLADIPVVIITARSGLNDHVAGLEAGAVDYVTKPVNFEILKARVKNYVSLKNQRDVLTKLATIDGLTGIPNRRSFDAALAREWRRLARADKPLSVVLIDVDHFKQFNDTYGHGEGDACLKAVAQALVGTLKRPSDMAARYGGEEFVLLLPEANIEGAKATAEAARAAVAALNIPHAQSSAAAHVTVSLGVAQIVPTDGPHPQLIVEAADRQLYIAKKGGRNRVQAAAHNNI